MSPFIERLVAEFTCASPKDDLANEFLAAQEAILKFGATGEGNPEWFPELVGTDLCAEEISALSAALRSFIVSRPEHPLVGSAIWAMSKLNDDQLIPFYIEQIRMHYAARQYHPASQADYALCRLGHDVPSNYWVQESTLEGTMEGYWRAVVQFLALHPKT